MTDEGETVPLSLFYSLKDKQKHGIWVMMAGGECGRRGTQHACRTDGNTVFMLPTNGLSPWNEGRHTTSKNTLRFHTRGSMNEVKHLKEPYPNRSGTCRFAAQGHPDYLTACVVSKAIHFLVIKPVSSCLLQLSEKE